ncbi:MAG: CRTAC1 family protein [Planctomycetes bacterium]|nr:CRTAC1 family protein [Planctomycetota bacterium]
MTRAQRVALAAALALLSVGFAATAQPKGRQSPAFTDVAREVGLKDVPAFRTGFVDLDGDGWPDLLILHGKNTDLETLRVFFNRPDPRGGRRFEEAPDRAELLASRHDDRKMGRVTSIFVAGDVDNDGREDVFTGAYCEFEKPKADKEGRPLRDEKGRPVMEMPDHGDRNEILLNRGAPGFKLGPLSDLGKHPDTICAAAFLDGDGDGRLDLFTGAWYRAYGSSLACYPDRLFLGKGDGSFRDVTERAGLLRTERPGTPASHRPTYGVAHTDWDNDGHQDILVCAYGRQWNLLWRNNGDGTFTDVGAATAFDGDEDRSGKHDPRARRRDEPPFRSNGNTFDAAVADFDNDGDMDVFLAEICHWWAAPASDRSALLVNQGPEEDFRFMRESRGIVRQHAGAGWNEGDIHAGWLDYDNDGLLDLLLASSDYPDDQFLRLFRQKPDHTFEDITAAAGFDLRNPTQISLADYDRDGDLDIVVGTSNMRLTPEQRKDRYLGVRLFRNDAGSRGSWLMLRLEGGGAGQANRSAIGARVWVRTGDVTQIREVYGGQGHAGHQDEKVLHFGLGPHAKADEVRVRWPDSKSTEQVFRGVKARTIYQLRQGGQLTAWKAK